MTITAGMVKTLRAQSGAGIMECKEALKESDGDIDGAVEFLRKKGAAKAAKKADRSTKEGIVTGLVEGGVAVLSEIKCETDFVARNDRFKEFSVQISQHVAKNGASDGAAMLEQSFAADESKSVKEALESAIHEIGENILIGRNNKLELEGNGGFGLYIHSGGSIGVLVEVGCEKAETKESGEFTTLLKDLAMQVAGASPVAIAITPDEVPADILAKEREIFETQAKESGKPEKIIPKIVEGRINKFYSEVCLLKQVYVKDPDKTVAKLVDDTASSLGDKLTVRRFVRYQLGE